MKLNKHLKKVIILIISLIILLNCGSSVLAGDGKSGLEQIIGAGSNFVKQGQDGAEDEEYFANMFIDIGQVLVAVGVVALLISTLIMAIKWITAKPDQQAKLKQQLIGLVVSAVVLFGAVGIWNLAKGIMKQVETSLATTQTIRIATYEYNDKYNFKEDNNKMILLTKEE